MHHELHRYVNTVEKEKRRFLSGKKPAKKRDACTSGLVWLAREAGNRDCLRFLSRAQEILHDVPPEFVDIYPNYWDAFGAVIGGIFSLHHQQENQSTQPVTPSPSALAKLADLFRCQTEVDWELRANIIRCLTAAVEGCAKPILSSSNGDLEQAFWRCMEFIKIYLHAAFDLPLPPHQALSTAAQYFIDCWFQLVDRLVQGAAEKRAPLDEAIVVRLVKIAVPALNMITRADMPYNAGLGLWNDALSTLGKSVERGSRSNQLQHEFDLIARQIWLLAKAEKRETNWQNYRTLLANLIPILQARIQAGDRKQMAESDSKCALGVNLNGTLIWLPARIENVCPTRYRGFAVETEGLQLRQDVPNGYVISSWRECDIEIAYRRAEVIVEKSSARLDALKLLFKYQGDHGPVCKQMDCRILRAWQLNNRAGAGFAILSPLEDSGELPDDWIAYVNGPKEEGRYRP